MIKTITALTVLTIIATVGINNAYAIEGDGTSHVEVDIYPFDITILEGGSMTLHNNGENTINFVSHGWFEGSVPVNDAIALEFPVVNCGTTCFTEGMYYISDLNGGYQSTITIVKPVPVYVEPVYVAPPVQEPIVQELVIVEPVVEPTPEPVVESQVDFGAVSSETLGSYETISDEGIYNVANYDGEVDMITMQTQLAEVTSQFNDSITKLAEQKVAIENYYNGTAIEVSTLEQTVLSLHLEKDTLNAQILTLGNTTAIQQTTITQLNAQVNDTSILDSKITNLEAQVVSLTSERNQWKQLANNWYAVAMEQLSVMINVLGI
jgi:uncharacterized coiled-coil protein SlyX